MNKHFLYFNMNKLSRQTSRSDWRLIWRYIREVRNHMEKNINQTLNDFLIYGKTNIDFRSNKDFSNTLPPIWNRP